MTDTKKFKDALEKELKLVETELAAIAVKAGTNPADPWEAVETEIDSDHADDNDVADNLESFSENRAVVDNLKIQYENIMRALKKISDGTYGICEVGKEAIPENRLLANPSARTCITHAQ